MAELGTLVHRVVVQRPGPFVPDGDGGSVASWIDLVPAAWKVSITPASAADLERVAPGTSISAAAYVVRGYFHPGITTQCRFVLNGRILAITGVVTPDLREVDMECGAVEVVV
jgi:head-tail adaptor